jgi:hypothetical protein
MTRNSLCAPFVPVALAVTLEARLMYFDLAQQWRELADQIEQLDRAPARGGAPEGEQNGNYRMARGTKKLLG